MKKLILLLVASLVLFSTLSAQITQEEADSIIRQRMDGETNLCTIYAKEEMQTEGFTITTATGEAIELDYPVWIYYVSYTGETFGKYLIVKENNGNLLEINTKNDSDPGDLAEWREVTFEIPFTEYYVEHSCDHPCWKYLNYPSNQGEFFIINDEEGLKQYFICTENYPPINFLEHTLLLVNGKTNQGIDKISKSLQKFSLNEYELNIEILLNDATVVEEWVIALIVEKLEEESTVELNVTYKEQFEAIITSDKTWYIEAGYACPEGDEIGCYCYYGLITIKTGDVKTFNGKEYYELLEEHPYQQWMVITYVREEEGRVFFYVEDCDKEYLMYDFNLNVGDEVVLVDTWNPFSHDDHGNPCELTEDDLSMSKFKVIEVNEIEYNQVKRKMLKLKYYFTDAYDIWVEGIGCLRGITFRTFQMTGVKQLKDCYESGELIFENKAPEYCWVP